MGSGKGTGLWGLVFSRAKTPPEGSTVVELLGGVIARELGANGMARAGHLWTLLWDYWSAGMFGGEFCTLHLQYIGFLVSWPPNVG